jgi:hypothetical protein
VLTAELSPAPREGQLAVFTSTFTSKDPFKQQLSDQEAAGGGSSKPAAGTPAAGVTPGTSPTLPTLPANTPAVQVISATIAVNGVAEGVNADADFPLATPIFHLVSLTATSARISIAGGSLATGSPTVTLKKGKTITLMNTADGTRYQLTLLATSSREAVATAPAAATTAAAATAAAAAAATTPTTTTPTG